MEEINLSGLREGRNEQPPQWNEQGHCIGPRRSPVVLLEKMPEDIEGLVKELQSAVEEYERLVSETKENVEEAENIRLKAETLRNKAEQLRANAEELRTSAEEGRTGSEADRVEAERLRNQAESLRVEAERLRASAEQGRSTAYTEAEAARNGLYQTAEAARNGLYQEAETARGTAYTTAEGLRDGAFEAKEATRDAANQAALNCAETLSALGPKIGQIAEVVGGIPFEHNVDLTAQTNFTWKDDYTVYATGSSEGMIASSSYSTIAIFDVSEYRGKTLHFAQRKRTSQKTTGLAFFTGDYNGEINSYNLIAGAGLAEAAGAAADNGEYQEATITIPANAGYVATAFWKESKSNFSAYVVAEAETEGLKKDVEDLQDDVEGIQNEMDSLSQNLVSIDYLSEGGGLFINGSYITMTGAEQSNNDYSSTDYLPIPVKKKIGLIHCQTGNRYMACIAFYDETKTFISALQMLTQTQAGDYEIQISQIPDNAAYIRVSGVLITSSNISKIDYSVSIKEEVQGQTSNIDSLVNRVSALENQDEMSKVIEFEALDGSATLEAGETLNLLTVKVKYNSLLSACIKGVIDDVCVGVGYTSGTAHRTFESRWLEITQTQVKLYGYYNDGNVLEETYTHGLSLTETTFVNITTGVSNTSSNPTTTVRISTDSGEEWEQSINWGQGSAFVENKNASGSLDVSLKFMPRDILKRVWCFGDSYFTYWPTNVYTLGINNWLRNSQPGLGQDQALVELQNLLSLGYTPSFVLWALGMNGSTSESKSSGEYVINPTQKTPIDSLKSLCENHGIVPVFTTIPTVPTRQKTGFGNYIKSLGCRYVDVSAAVGADEYGIWHGKPTLRGWTYGSDTIYTQVYGDGHGFILSGDNVFDQDGNFLNLTVESVGSNNSTITVDGTTYQRDSTKDIAGLLSSDGIHPSELGAKVIAMAILSEFPEISSTE